MNASKPVAALLAVLLVSTGVGAVAATPGNGTAPDDAAGDAANAPTNAPMNDANATDAREEAKRDAETVDERRGPPTDLPEQVPDHVTELHQRIVGFLDGELDRLGSAVSDVTPDGEGPSEATTTTEA